jgi:predicted dinucleotide-binding enzyme
MKIAMIGAGNVGKALTKASLRAGHTISISASSEREVDEVTSQIGGSAAASNQDAIADAELVVLAVPFDVVSGIIEEAVSALDGKIVVDVTNRFAPEKLGAPSNAELIQEMAPNARVVKAINTVFASRQADPSIDGVQLDGFVAGDDSTAKAAVLQWVQSLGFRPIDAGPLAMARALEGMGLLNISLNMSHGWSWQTGWKLVGPTD